MELLTESEGVGPECWLELTSAVHELLLKKTCWTKQTKTCCMMFMASLRDTQH